MNKQINDNIITGTGDNTGFEENNIKDYDAIYNLYTENTYFPEVDTIISTTYVGKNSSHAIFGTGLKSDILVSLNINELSLINTFEKGQVVDILVKEILDDKKDTIMYGSAFEVKYFIHNSKVLEILELYAKTKQAMTGIPISYTENSYGYEIGYDVAVNIEYGETLIHLPHLLADINKLPNPDSIMGQEIQFHIIKDEQLGFVASRKSYLKTLGKKEINDLVIGDVYTGFVTGTRPYAIFVQIGNLTGMVHVSNLGEEGQQMLKDGKVVPGMEIEVYLKDIIHDKLTLTQIWRESIWSTIKIGNLYEGEITDIKTFNEKDFGVLVQLDYETKGMIHSSNLKGDITNYKVGNIMKVKVQNIYKNKRLITLLPQ